MPALYSHTTRATGTVLTATIYNGDHQNHIDNGVPGQLDDYSTSVGQMQTATDPGGVGTESLATSLAGELERIRFVLKSLSQGAQWYSGGAIAGLLGYSRVQGQTGFNNSVSPDSKYDVAADAVVLRSASGGTVVRTNTGTVTNDTGLSGPAANGRDQSGAFSANSWIHLYWIWNGTTLATVSSTVAPPTGPTLPTGYTHWAYLSTIRMSGSSTLSRLYTRGAEVFWQTNQTVLNGGTATTPTSVSVSNFIPPNALSYSVLGESALTAAGAVANWTLDISVISASSIRVLRAALDGIANVVVQTMTLCYLPNVSQQFFYAHSIISGTGPSAIINLNSYVIPNGDA